MKAIVCISVNSSLINNLKLSRGLEAAIPFPHKIKSSNKHKKAINQTKTRTKTKTKTKQANNTKGIKTNINHGPTKQNKTKQHNTETIETIKTRMRHTFLETEGKENEKSLLVIRNFRCVAKLCSTNSSPCGSWRDLLQV